MQIKLEGAHESAYLRQALAFNAEEFRGPRHPGYAPFWKIFLGVMSGLSQGTLLSNLKSVALTVFKLLALLTPAGPLRTHRHRQT